MALEICCSSRLGCQRVEQIICRQGIMFRGAIPAGQVLKLRRAPATISSSPIGEHTALDRTGCQRADTLYPAKARRPVLMSRLLMASVCSSA